MAKKKNSKNKNLLIIGGAVVLFVIAMFLMNSAGVLNLRSMVAVSNPYALYSPTPTYNPLALQDDDILFGDGAPCSSQKTWSASKISNGATACTVAAEAASTNGPQDAQLLDCISYNTSRCENGGGTSRQECDTETTEYTFSCTAKYVCRVFCSLDGNSAPPQPSPATDPVIDFSNYR